MHRDRQRPEAEFRKALRFRDRARNVVHRDDRRDDEPVRMLAEQFVVIVVQHARHRELERGVARGEAVERAVRVDDLRADAVERLVAHAERDVGSAGTVEHAADLVAFLVAPVAFLVVLAERVERL